MSIKVMTAVFERYPNGGCEMLIAILHRFKRGLGSPADFFVSR